MNASILPLDDLDEHGRRLFRTRRVLARDELAVAHDVLAPRLGGRLEGCPELAQARLDEEGDGVLEADLALLGIREAGHPPAGDEGLPVRQLHVAKDDGTVADGRDGLVGGDKLADELDRVDVPPEVKAGTVPADVKDGGVARVLDGEEGRRLLDGRLGLFVLEKLLALGIVLECRDGGWVAGGLASGWGGNVDGVASIDEFIVWVSELRPRSSISLILAREK